MRKCLILLIAFLLASCASSETRVTTALSQTTATRPTDTLTPTYTLTPKVARPPGAPASTRTLTPQTATLADTPASTSSPTLKIEPDGRIIVGQPVDYMPRPEELARWYWSPGISSWDSPITNEQIIDLLGVEEGQKYIEKTGRKLGHSRCLLRKTGNDYLPEIICFTVIFYETTEGASLALTPDWDPLDWYTDEIFIEGIETIGEESYFTYKEHDVDGDENDIDFTSRFRIRNVHGGVNIWGKKGYIDVRYLINLTKWLESILLYAPTMNP
jgi:hypothetical protein